MNRNIQCYIGHDVISNLIDYCQERQYRRFFMVADQNTYPVLGKKVEEALKSSGLEDIKVLILGDLGNVVANEDSLIQVFLSLEGIDRVFLAVGSGTITDITRFVSHRTRNKFICLPTAPSVDGFTSIGAPLVVRGLKRTYTCHPPEALFVDIHTLASAPMPLIAAGLGDLLGKFTSSADFELGHIIFDESYDEEICNRIRSAAVRCTEYIDEISQRTETGIRILIEGLIESGLCMLEFGNSHPASGTEHQIAHFWEMKLLWENRPALLHGAEVGVASVITAGWYKQLTKLDTAQVKNILENARLPEPDQVEAHLRKIFGRIAETIIQEQRQFIRMSQDEFSNLKSRIVSNWDRIKQIASEVPSPDLLRKWLRQCNAPVTGEELGLSEEEILLGVNFGHFIRKRFIVNKLRQLLGVRDMD